MQNEPKSKAARHAETRAALLKAGRELFTAAGYADTGTEDVAAEAGVTRGALYYHFPDKRALFEAVLEEVAQDVLAATEHAALGARDPMDGLIKGSRAIVQAALADDTRRIYLVDAPAVLGWARWREVDARYAMGSLRQGVAALLAERPDPALDVEAVTHLLSGALNEAALALAEADALGLKGLKFERSYVALVRRLFAGSPGALDSLK